MRNKKATASIFIGILLLILIVAVISTTPNSKKASKEEPVNQVTAEGEFSETFKKTCLNCHATDKDGKVARISDIRKTPEGWEQTIFRMKNQWGLEISNEDIAKIVEELSMKNGLAPEETEKVMYWLTDNGSTMEAPMENEIMAGSCIQCHAGARPLAQYRTPEEWMKIKDFHIGLNPSMVYQMRATNWPEDATKVAEYLGKVNPKETESWKAWLEKGKKYDVSGDWRIVGYQPGVGMYSGDATFEKKDDAYYEMKTLSMADSSKVKYEGNVKMFTGYSLRSSLKNDQQKVRGVFNVQNDNTITGRWNEVDNIGVYANETYYKKTQTALLAAWPKAIKKDSEQTVHLIGMNLPEKLSLSDFKAAGIEITEIVKQEKDDVWVKVKASSTAEVSNHSITLANSTKGTDLFVYDEVDYLKVTPEYGIARLAYDNRKQSVQYEAIAYNAGKDGKEKTDDDIEIGPVAVTWSLKEYKFMGMEDEDIKYVGTINKDTGLFVPGNGGLNAKREWSTNNSGNVTVVAQFKDPVTAKLVTGETFMLVTIPDFVYIK